MVDLSAVLKSINESKKKSTFVVTKLSDPKTLARVEQHIPTGCLPLDVILAGGYPVRRIVEIYGDNSTGKTLLATEAAIETQQLGGLVVYADAEIALGVDRMIELGVDPDNLIYANVDTIGDAFDLLDSSIEAKNKHYGKSGILTFIVDSVAALVEKEAYEKDHDYEAKKYPRVAAVMSTSLRIIASKVAKNNVCLIFTNQTRQKLGVMFGDGATTTGGTALRFYSSLRLELQGRSKIPNPKGKTKDAIGVNAQVMAVKNRLAPPFRKLTLPIYYSMGVDETFATLEFLRYHDLINVEGSWSTLKLKGEELKFQRNTFPELFDKHYDAIEELVWSVY